MYAKLNKDNTSIEKYPVSFTEIRYTHKNVSFPDNPTDEDLASFNYCNVQNNEVPQYDIELQYVQEDTPIKNNGVWKKTYKLVNLDNLRKEGIVRAKEDSIKTIRNALLSETDWTQLSDVPAETASKFAQYRQALRDVTNQEGYPDNVVWPEKP
jgi:hypothetical protein